jgi:hypothetical protein
MGDTHVVGSCVHYLYPSPCQEFVKRRAEEALFRQAHASSSPSLCCSYADASLAERIIINHAWQAHTRQIVCIQSRASIISFSWAQISPESQSVATDGGRKRPWDTRARALRDPQPAQGAGSPARRRMRNPQKQRMNLDSKRGA